MKPGVAAGANVGDPCWVHSKKRNIYCNIRTVGRSLICKKNILITGAIEDIKLIIAVPVAV
jgi:hypothetical protein